MGIGNIANTGMRAAMTDMEVISNNISNANTAGFKRSSATFGDIYPQSAAGSLQAGLGVQLTDIRQDFKTGSQMLTSGALDLMINADGFFTLKDPNSGITSYTRAGRFEADDEGYIMTNNGTRLQGFPAVNGVIQDSGDLIDMQISNTPRTATATSEIDSNINLNAAATVPAAAFDPNDTDTFNYKTNTTIYDSLGNTHSVETYYRKTADNNWNVYVYADSVSVGSGTAVFNTDGSLASTTGLGALSFAPGSGAASPQAFAISLTGSTQFVGDSDNRKTSANGSAVGNLSSFEVSNSGEVIASYSNGERVIMGQIAVARFSSTAGLANAGNMSWLETSESGAPQLSPSNSSNAIRSGLLEGSNVDLTQEMIALLNAQHNFQANAQVEQTFNQVMQTVVQI